MAKQISTLTFFKYQSLKNKVWAFGMMQFAHAHLRNVAGLQFYKLLGSGKAGFDPRPDWSVYALLQVWDDETAADTFFENSKLVARYKQRSTAQYTLYLKNKIARGKWAGQTPFVPHKDLSETIPQIAVITRATIKTKFLRKFWKYVPTSQEPLWKNDGLLFTKGIGEVPISQMATFSLWKDQEALDTYAYQSKEHIKAIGETRRLNWYKEELFSRFQPYRSIGSWEGVAPIDF